MTRIIPRDEIYLGRTYSSYVSDWFNWFVSADADKRNFGPVVFLRASGLPMSKDDGKLSSLENEYAISNSYTDDINYVRRYGNTPNIRIGGDKLRINDSQAVMVPIITAFDVARKPYNDWGSMSDAVGLTIDYGDNPPEQMQLLVDGNPILKDKDFSNFRIATPIFPAVVPETDYGRSVKDFLEESYPAGNYAAIVEGYFVLIQLTGGKTYLIHAKASAPREARGPYFSELIYEIEVERSERGKSKRDANYYATLRKGAQQSSPPRNKAIITKTITEKYKNGELKRDDAKTILKSVKLANTDSDADQILDQT